VIVEYKPDDIVIVDPISDENNIDCVANVEILEIVILLMLIVELTIVDTLIIFAEIFVFKDNVEIVL